MAEGPTQDTAQRYLPKAQPLFLDQSQTAVHGRVLRM